MIGGPEIVAIAPAGPLTEQDAAEIAMSASCSDVGSGITAQSPYTSTRSARHMKNTLDTTDTPGTVRITSNAGLSRGSSMSFL